MKGELDIWAAEAKKHNMHYGDYVAAVERHGILPPPPKEKPKPPPKSDAKMRSCIMCGEEFEIEKRLNGTYSMAKLCEKCREKRRHQHGKDE